jgi:hypothetical protein
MEFVKSMVGFLMAALASNTLWSVFTNKFGITGGWISAFIITGTLWYINHHKGLISNEKDSAFVDMALGIALSIIIRDIFSYGIKAAIDSIPTFVFVTIGGAAGGTVAAVLEGKIQKKKSQKELLKTDCQSAHEAA